jgi:arylsulfatase
LTSNTTVPGFGKGGTGVLSVDGKAVATKTIPHTIPFVETIYETFDVGVDTRTGVDDSDYQPPFRFAGKIDRLTVKLVPLKAAEERHLQQNILKIRPSNSCLIASETRPLRL